MRLTQQQLEAHLWGAANILRGKTAGQDYKNYILSLMFFKRLCDQWDHESDERIAEMERERGQAFTEQQKALLRAREDHRFNIPEGSRWGDILAVCRRISARSSPTRCGRSPMPMRSCAAFSQSTGTSRPPMPVARS